MPADPMIGTQLMEVSAPLLGKRVLVVEDDYLLAADLGRGLADLGATVLGPAPTPFYALGLLGRRGVDAAILDIRLHGTDVFEVAKELVARHIPMIFVTASSAEDLPRVYRNFPVLQKPVQPEELYAVLQGILLAPKAEIEKPRAAPSPHEPDGDKLMRAVVRALRLSQGPAA